MVFSNVLIKNTPAQLISISTSSKVLSHNKPFTSDMSPKSHLMMSHSIPSISELGLTIAVILESKDKSNLIISLPKPPAPPVITTFLFL